MDAISVASEDQIAARSPGIDHINQRNTLSLKELLFGTEKADELLAECNKIADGPCNDVQGIASRLQKMIIIYYMDARRQASLAFVVALVLEIIGIIFLMTAAATAMVSWNMAVVTCISGVVTQGLTGVVFFFYFRLARQFAAFHICLERTNRFLLANGFAEHLPEGDCRESKRGEVITAVLNAPMLTIEMFGSTVRRRSLPKRSKAVHAQTE